MLGYDARLPTSQMSIDVHDEALVDPHQRHTLTRAFEFNFMSSWAENSTLGNIKENSNIK